MSQPPSVRTITEGIKDIAALLPLLGTDQCEKHVGSALGGGYLYAAATPLSIFGSLGIVKIGISVLVSSISVPNPSFSFKFSPYPVTFHGRRWLGARILDNAGFEPVGTVAPLIAMDGTRYTAETRLMEILKEKHIEDAQHLSVEWKSKEWNVKLVLCTMVAAAFSVIPYIAFTLPRFRSSVVHSPWLFPILRTVFSSLAAVCCQFLIQLRVISLMKNRIIFMIMNNILLDKSKSTESNNPDLDILSQNAFQWDENLPSEECLWNLEQYLRSQCSNTDNPNEGGKLPTSWFSEILDKLHNVRNEHIHTSFCNRVFISISWLILLVSLPAIVAGYIGCFTLVSGSRGNRPLIWLLLEAGLSIIRILVWAWNPSFDEGTDITVRLKLTDHQPLVTTEKYIKETGENILSLVSERQFLEWITSYTGPLETFRMSENFVLYFTLTGTRAEQKRLYLTVFDFNERIAVTLLHEEGELVLFDTIVTYDDIAKEMQALLPSASGKDNLWSKKHAILFNTLSNHYFSIIHALNQSHLQTTPGTPSGKTVSIPRKWDLLGLPKHTESNDQCCANPRKPLPLRLTEHDNLYLERGYEHHLKTELVKNWSGFIVDNLDNIRIDAQNDCHHALTDRSSEKAKWELTELDMQLAFEWTRREWLLVVSSSDLEDILHQRKERCINEIVKKRQNGPLGEWTQSEFVVGRQKRLENEREQAMERMEKEMKVRAECAEAEERAWGDQQVFSPKGMWEAGKTFIEEQWRATIQSRKEELESYLDRLVDNETPRNGGQGTEERFLFVEQVRDRFKHWRHQYRNEKDEMDAIIKRINTDTYDLDAAYQYPWDQHVTHKFVELQYLQAVAKLCSATVYDVRYCDADSINDVVQKKTTRSVINVPSHLVDSIHENDHLLYLSSEDGQSQEPPFIQQNRKRWWDPQMTYNSSTFYFSPQRVVDKYVCSVKSQTIAHIFIFLQTRRRLRLRLLHQSESKQTSVSIQENNEEACPIDKVPEQLQLQDFELDWFEPGKHELQLVVTKGTYCLRDLLVEFFEDPRQD